MNIKLIISYDGSRFFGWQKNRAGPSIEQELERAISSIHSQVFLEAASRTDRGVHAKGQVVRFVTDKEINPRRFARGLNAVLPPEISVQSVEPVKIAFHPTLDARSKEYCYFLCNSHAQSPIHRLYSWHFPRILDLALMRQAARDFLGTHDFSAFTNAQTEDPCRTIEDIDIVSLESDRLSIKVRGDSFLYKMARNLVGTLVMIGCGKLPPDCVANLIASRDRKKAGMTAPAHGLFLWQVFYPE